MKDDPEINHLQERGGTGEIIHAILEFLQRQSVKRPFYSCVSQFTKTVTSAFYKFGQFFCLTSAQSLGHKSTNVTWAIQMIPFTLTTTSKAKIAVIP